jgi:hypothetical protein
MVPGTRHLTPVLLKKKIDEINPCFVNYMRDATLDKVLAQLSAGTQLAVIRDSLMVEYSTRGS